MTNKLKLRKNEINQWIAQIEVFMALGMILSLIFPSRQILAAFMFFQYIRLRYSLSGYTRITFSGIRSFLDSWLLSPRSPPIMRSLYSKICHWISSFGDIAQQAASQPQRSKCSIL